MKESIQIRFDHLMWLNRLIGETQGMLECISIQARAIEGMSHIPNPVGFLVEEWQNFVDSVLSIEKKND